MDSDSCSEFINNHLTTYCKDEHITFSRGGSYRKNDNCYVEQKNYSVVRRGGGYLRYDTEEELPVLNVSFGLKTKQKYQKCFLISIAQALSLLL